MKIEGMDIQAGQEAEHRYRRQWTHEWDGETLVVTRQISLPHRQLRKERRGNRGNK